MRRVQTSSQIRSNRSVADTFCPIVAFKLFSSAIETTAMYMLSFSRGRPIAAALDKRGRVVHTIHVTPDEKEPDIMAENILDLIDLVDIQSIKRELKLGLIESKILMKAIRLNKPEGLSEKLKRAFELLVERANEKLKKEVFFQGSDVATVVPLVGRDGKFDRSIALFGASGAGKSFLAKQVMQLDPHRRPCVVFSKIRDDPSLKEIGEQKLHDGKSRLIQVPLFCDQDLLDLPADDDLTGTICFFDDIDSLMGERSEYMRTYRDALLESGRHKNITVLSTSHVLRNYNKTRILLNECEWAVLFPNSNRRASSMFLHDRLGMDAEERRRLIDRASISGRHLAIKMSNPMCMLHGQGVILI